MGGVALVGWLPGGLGGRWFEGSSRLASARAATEFMSCGDKEQRVKSGSQHEVEHDNTLKVINLKGNVWS